MRPANLLPPDIGYSRRRPPAAALAALGAGVAVGALVADGFAVQHGKVQDKRAELDALKAELAAVPAPKKPATEIPPELKAEREPRLAALNAALAERIAWDRVLRELSQVLPEDVWLSNLSAKSPTAIGSTGTVTPPADAAAGSNGLVVNGYTYSQEGVARLLSRLALVPNLDNVKLQTSAVAEVGGRRIVSFTVAADIRAAGGVTQ